MAQGNQSVIIKTKMEENDYKYFLLANAFNINIIGSLLKFGALACICTLVVWNIRKINQMAVMLGFFMGFLLLLFLIEYTKLIIQTKIRVKEDTLNQFGTIQEMIFGPSEITVSVKKMEGKSIIRYKQIIKLVETKEYYYLYMAKNMAAIIRKKDLTAENIEELTFFLYWFRRFSVPGTRYNSYCNFCNRNCNIYLLD